VSDGVPAQAVGAGVLSVTGRYRRSIPLIQQRETDIGRRAHNGTIIPIRRVVLVYHGLGLIFRMEAGRGRQLPMERAQLTGVPG
jgi:hypothetical protein